MTGSAGSSNEYGKDSHMIEFTDRYGGNMPSSLRGCFECDAMGCYPEPPPEARNPDGTINIDCPVDWSFVTCSACNGTAKVSWFTTLRRIPGWLVRGVRFTVIEAPRFYAGESRITGMKAGFQASILADLGIRRSR